MYLYIAEDGALNKSADFDETDQEMCDMGILDVIDLHGENPKQYFEGEWHDIDLIKGDG